MRRSGAQRHRDKAWGAEFGPGPCGHPDELNRLLDVPFSRNPTVRDSLVRARVRLIPVGRLSQPAEVERVMPDRGRKEESWRRFA